MTMYGDYDLTTVGSASNAPLITSGDKQPWETLRVFSGQLLLRFLVYYSVTVTRKYDIIGQLGHYWRISMKSVIWDYRLYLEFMSSFAKMSNDAHIICVFILRVWHMFSKLKSNAKDFKRWWQRFPQYLFHINQSPYHHSKQSPNVLSLYYQCMYFSSRFFAYV